MRVGLLRHGNLVYVKGFIYDYAGVVGEQDILFLRDLGKAIQIRFYPQEDLETMTNAETKREWDILYSF